MTEQDIDKLIELSFEGMDSLGDIRKLVDARKFLCKKDPTVENARKANNMVFTYMVSGLSCGMLGIRDGIPEFTRERVNDAFQKCLNALEKYNA